MTLIPVDFDPYSHRWKQDPYSKYRELRDASPVHYAPASDTWTISRHADVQHVLTTPDVFSSKIDRRREILKEAGAFARIRLAFNFLRRMRASPFAMNNARMLIQEDGRAHALMRDVVNRGFTPRRISAWEDRIHELATEGLTRLRARGRFDLVNELAVPLPVTVIAEILGIDPADQRTFKRWSDHIIEAGTGSGMGSFADGPGMDAMVELRHYLKPVIAERRKRPAEDLISTLVTAEGPAALNDLEVYLFVLLLLVAGNETTTNLLGNAVDALIEHPDELERVCAIPALIPQLIEEVLRFDSPVQCINRQTTREVELAGTRIPADAAIVVLLGSANRDERHFPEPDRFDVSRDTRGHVAFGFGAHFCLGAALARLEAKAALEVLVPELPRLVRVAPEREFLDSYLLRGRVRLELRPAA